jgi:hypothetical protein
LKNGQPIRFSIGDPSSYTDCATDARLIANQLNNEGFEVPSTASRPRSGTATSPPGTSRRFPLQRPESHSVATQAPVIPLVYGAAWYEYSTWNYTGWPTAANPYIDPVPNAPYVEHTLLHLTPAS